mmetsp:Transcript_12596/g.36598  ORF Transcript_12596/g.36598 Transcript_12596/m.36598 type:complete len:226 (+) Transcript_12596:974-1651(+)
MSICITACWRCSRRPCRRASCPSMQAPSTASCSPPPTEWRDTRCSSRRSRRLASPTRPSRPSSLPPRPWTSSGPLTRRCPSCSPMRPRPSCSPPRSSAATRSSPASTSSTPRSPHTHQPPSDPNHQQPQPPAAHLHLSNSRAPAAAAPAMRIPPAIWCRCWSSTSPVSVCSRCLRRRASRRARSVSSPSRSAARPSTSTSASACRRRATRARVWCWTQSWRQRLA